KVEDEPKVEDEQKIEDEPKIENETASVADEAVPDYEKEIDDVINSVIADESPRQNTDTPDEIHSEKPAAPEKEDSQFPTASADDSTDTAHTDISQEKEDASFSEPAPKQSTSDTEEDTDSSPMKRSSARESWSADLKSLNEEILNNAKPKSKNESEIPHKDDLDLSAVIDNLKRARSRRRSMPKTRDSEFSSKLAADEGGDHIPDHVLTPTFADIYLQQGQPHLAREIYRRLAQNQTDNEEYLQKIATIDAIIEESENDDTQTS
ncbi:MAG: hypothetical protein ACQEQ4_08035, partial [Fibrobacterota bacterium]